jgi:hypothetical protein
MDVTLASIISWDPVAGAEYQYQVLSATNVVLVPATDTGTTPSVSVGVALAGQPAGTYKIQARAMQSGGALAGPWAGLTVNLTGYGPLTGFTIT